MECPQCGGDDTNVIDSRPSRDAIRRRRTCGRCEHRFTTYERIAELEPVVVKRDGRREPFQYDKIRHGVRLAAAKGALPEPEIERITEAVRTRAVQTARAEIAATTLGEWVWEALQEVDRVAAFRFGAVFARPGDLEAVRRQLAAAESGRPAPAHADGADATQPRLPGIGGAAAAPDATPPATAD